MNDLQQQILAAAAQLAQAQRVIVLTGAGISAESGIPTFRDAQTGLWAKYDPMELASPQGFRENPRVVWEWYEYRRQIVRRSQPNAGHLALVELQELVPNLIVITQNVDELHTRAGSNRVLELHGQIMRNLCFREGRELTATELRHDSLPPTCPCGAFARPGVVWFGEQLPPEVLDSALAAAQACDLCLVVGTAGVVQPAATLPFIARENGATVIEINNQESAITPIAAIFLSGKAGEILPELINQLRAKKTLAASL
jgi:NAD-dependent deacetylase